MSSVVRGHGVWHRGYCKGHCAWTLEAWFGGRGARLGVLLGTGIGTDRAATATTHDYYLLTSTSHSGRAQMETQLAALSSSSHGGHESIALTRSASFWLYGKPAPRASAWDTRLTTDSRREARSVTFAAILLSDPSIDLEIPPTRFLFIVRCLALIFEAVPSLQSHLTLCSNTRALEVSAPHTALIIQPSSFHDPCR